MMTRLLSLLPVLVTLSTYAGSNALASAPGQILSPGAVTCPAGAPAGAQCTKLTVRCPQVPDISVTIGVAEPTSPADRTILLHGGGGGTAFFKGGAVPGGFPSEYVSRGHRVVQVAWGSSWSGSGTAGSYLLAACRMATLLDWVFQNVHQADRSRAFCAQGHSGGSAAIGYALSQYGADAQLDFVMLHGGPALARIDYGCNPSLYGTGTRPVCESQPDYSYVYTSQTQKTVNSALKTRTCGKPTPSASDLAKWISQSVVSPTGNYHYAQTPVHTWLCANATNETVGQGAFLIDAISSEKKLTCGGGTCVGEDVFADAANFAAMADEMSAQCIPRH